MANGKHDIGDKIVKENTRAIEELEKSLKEMAKSRAKLDGRTKEAKELTAKMTDAMSEMSERSDKLFKMSGQGVHNTAKTMAQTSGMERGTKRMFEEALSSMVHKDENIRAALKHGDSDVVRKQMVSQMHELAKTMEFTNDEEKENFKFLIDNMKENFNEAFDWETIEKKGMSIFFPMTQTMWMAAEEVRSGLQQIPKIGNLFTRDMVEHYRQGIGEIGGMLKREFEPVLAPLDALVGPFGAVLKGGFMFMKTLFSQSTEHEKKTAEFTQKNYEVLSSILERDKKEELRGDEPKKKGFLKYLIPISALIIGFFQGLFKELGMFAKPFKFVAEKFKGFKNFKFMDKIFGFFDRIKKLTDKFKIGRIAKGVGNILGRLFIPIMAAWEAVKGFMKGESLRDKLLGASVGIFKTLLDLPVWLANKVMGMFTDFQIDFSTEAIIESINYATEWLYQNVTVRIGDFFTKTVPETFSSFTSWIDGIAASIREWTSSLDEWVQVNIKDKISSGFGKAMDIGAMIKNQIIDILISVLDKLPIVNKAIPTLEKMKSTPSVGGNTVSKNVSSVDVSAGGSVEADVASKQIAGNQATLSALGETNKNITENTKVSKQMVENQQNIQIVESKSEDIPSEPENMGVLLFNKNWGLS